LTKEELHNICQLPMTYRSTAGKYRGNELKMILHYSVELVPLQAREQFANGDKRNKPNAYPGLPAQEGRTTLTGTFSGGWQSFTGNLKKMAMMMAAIALIGGLIFYQFFFCKAMQTPCLWK